MWVWVGLSLHLSLPSSIHKQGSALRIRSKTSVSEQKYQQWAVFWWFIIMAQHRVHWMAGLVQGSDWGQGILQLKQVIAKSQPEPLSVHPIKARISESPRSGRYFVSYFLFFLVWEWSEGCLWCGYSCPRARPYWTWTRFSQLMLLSWSMAMDRRERVRTVGMIWCLGKSEDKACVYELSPWSFPSFKLFFRPGSCFEAHTGFRLSSVHLVNLERVGNPLPLSFRGLLSEKIVSQYVQVKTDPSA